MRRRRGQRVCVHLGPFFGPSASATREREQKTRSVLREGRATSTMTLERGLPGGRERRRKRCQWWTTVYPRDKPTDGHT